VKRFTHTVPAESSAAQKIGEGTVLHRRVEITLEREVLQVMYQPGASFTGRCEECGKDVTLLSAEAAAAEASVTPREIYRWIEEETLHFRELPTGKVFVCSESLRCQPKRKLP
jgi:hypothetical protein